MEYVLVMPSSKLYISFFESFIHAYKHWLSLQGREAWFIVDEFHPIPSLGFPAEWYRLADPCKWPRPNTTRPTRTNRGRWLRHGGRITT